MSSFYSNFGTHWTINGCSEVVLSRTETKGTHFIQGWAVKCIRQAVGPHAVSTAGQVMISLRIFKKEVEVADGVSTWASLRGCEEEATSSELIRPGVSVRH